MGRSFISIGILLTCITGFIGYYGYFQETNAPATLLDSFYSTLRLFVFEFDADQGKHPWPLELARWLAPATLTYAAITAIIAVMGENWDRIRIKRLKQHAIVCGLNEYSIKTIESFTKAKIAIVVIEVDKNNRYLGLAKAHGSHIIIGNPEDFSQLSNANIQKASYLLAASEDDDINTELIYKAFDHRTQFKDLPELNCAVHIQDYDVAEVLYDQPVFRQDYGNFSAGIFNNTQIAARGLLSQHGPDIELSLKNNNLEKLSILLTGNDDFIDDLIFRFAQIGHYGYQHKVSISVIGINARQRIQNLNKRHPALETIIDLEADEVDLSILTSDESQLCLNRVNPDIVYVCATNITKTLVWTQTLLKLMPGTPTIVCDFNTDFMLRMLKKEFIRHSNIHFSNLMDNNYSYENVFNATNDALAMAIHEEYINEQTCLGVTIENNPSMANWKQLSETLKTANRNQADHAQIKCRLLTRQSNYSPDDVKALLDQSNIETFAIIEHQRWMSEKLLSGWRYSSGQKNNDLRLSPCLISWDQLSDIEKEKDRDSIRNLPNLVKLLAAINTNKHQ